MTHLAINLLGHFEVTLGGQPAPRFRTDKMRALLAYLAVEAEREHRRAMLVGLLWPEFPEADAHHNLSQALWRLRQLLGKGSPPFFLTTRQTLQLNPASDVTSDVADFQSGIAMCTWMPPEQISEAEAQTLTRAMALYRGEFMSTPLQVNSQAFEEWLLLTRTHIHLQALDVLSYLGQYHLLRGEFAQAATYARRQIALEPLSEAAHRQLMEALARDDRRPEALAQYTVCENKLSQELGISPAAETTALYEQIRATRGSLSGERPARALSGAAAQRHTKPGTGPLAPLPPAFVGRTRELARLDEALTLALAGQGQMRFVTGESGSGKTALIEAFARRAVAEHGDLLELNGSGNAYTGLGDPYWPFLEMLRQLCAPPRPDPGASSSLSPLQTQRLAAVRPLVTQLLRQHSPALLSLLTDDGPAIGAPGLAQTSLFDPITRALQVVAARRPLLLLLDDAQWADQDSLNLLFHLGRHLAGQRLLLLTAFRTDALAASRVFPAYLQTQDEAQRQPLTALVQDLQCYLGDIQIDLTQASGQDFIHALLDSEPNLLDAAFRETLYQHTGGHALFTIELLRGMQTRGDLVRDARGFWVAGSKIAWDILPARVEAVIAARIRRLLPAWQSMLAVASVEGAEFTIQVVARVLGLPEAEVSRRLSGALSQHHYLVTPVGVNAGLARYRFRHLLFQKHLYDRLDAIKRAQLHLQIGETLEALYGEHATDISLILARHFELGGVANKAVPYLFHAIQHAIHLAATEEALRLLTHGLALLQQLATSPEHIKQEAQLQLALGTVLQAHGWDTPERTRAVERAYELCQRIGDPGLLARSLQLLGSSKLARGHPDEVIAIGEQLRSLAHATQEAQTAIFAHYTLGSGYLFRGALHPARQYLEQTIDLYDTHAPTLLLLTMTDVGVGSRVWLTYTLWALGYADQALAWSQQALALARALGHPPSLWLALGHGLLTVQQLRRDAQALRATLQRMDTLGSNAEPGFFQLWITLFQGWLRVVADHDADGLSQIQEAIREWEASGTKGGRLQQLMLSIEAHLTLGQPAAALDILDQALGHIDATGIRFFEAELRRLKGEALRALGKPDEAASCFQRALIVAQKQSAKAWELRAAMSLCRLYQAAAPATKAAVTRTQLSEVYGWFTEGLDTADLQEARGLLAISVGWFKR